MSFAEFLKKPKVRECIVPGKVAQLIAMYKTWRAKISRDRGKRFEQRCCRLLPGLLDHDHFKRTGSIGKQHRGDIVPCDAAGKVAQDLLDRWYIECKVRAILTPRQIREWAREVRHAGRHACFAWLLFGQHRGPVYALYCDSREAKDDWVMWVEIIEEKEQ